MSISDQEDSVVKVGSAFVTGNDSTGVGLEDWFVGLDGNWNGLSGSSNQELVWGVWLNNSVIRELDLSFILGLLADTILTGVGIVSFKLHSSVNGEIECTEHPSSIATSIAHIGWAVNQLLFWKGDQFTSADLGDTFHGSSSREWPAWSAWTLVLHWGHSSCISPINQIWKSGGGSEMLDLWLVDWWHLRSVSEHWFPFVVIEVSELVDSLGVTFFLGVMGQDVVVDLSEQWESVFIFLFGSVASSVFWHECYECSFSIW
jgi:hypothetical protein